MNDETEAAKSGDGPTALSRTRADGRLRVERATLKELATSLQPVVEGKVSAESKDGSTAALVDFLQRHGM